MYRIFTVAIFCTLLFSQNTYAQSAKKQSPPNKVIPKSAKQLKERNFAPAAPMATDPFNVGKLQYRSLNAPNINPNARSTARVLRDEQSGLPYFIRQKTEASSLDTESSPAEQALAYANTLDLPKITDAKTEFEVVTAKTDAAGNQHIKLQQMWKGIEVYGAEIIVHSHNEKFDMMNGRYLPSPTALTNMTPAISEAAIIDLVKASMQDTRTWTADELRLVSGTTHTAHLVIFHKNETPYLAWHVIARPDPMHRQELFLDANTGEILEEYDNTCKIDGGRLEGHVHTHRHDAANEKAVFSKENEAKTYKNAPNVVGPVIGTGLDLLNVNRTFGAYESGGTVFMEDTRKSMFNAAASTFPQDPVGVIVTLDAQNKSPENANFDVILVASSSNTFSNKKAAVSAHWNSNLCYDYFENTFSRQSIDGLKGNILSIVNVSEGNGASMENAFWNGEAMFYGNGGSSFNPLAAGLDVGGHEMTHGVIEKTANLIYKNESGALNESFADIFGVMIDRDDWKIGEDVMKPGVSPNNALRSMEDPHNGTNNSNSPWWQPSHYNERYTGTQDNGGVHINSGITNHAFYLFAIANGVGKDKAERVYYKALDEYLVKSSRFVDCRAAVVQAAEDLYGVAVATAAANAFTQVGIAGANPGGGGGGNPNPGGDYLGNLGPNPGTQYLLVTTEDNTTLQLADANGNILGDLYSEGVLSKPSVTDNGSEIVFVNTAGHIVDIVLAYNGGTITPSTQIISPQPSWRNVAISKNGRFIAALTDNDDNTINVFDFGVSPAASQVFTLYNPTFTSGQVTNNVNFADVLEFDYSGEYIMYDAENGITNQGQDQTYWDIGFLQFFENNQFTDGVDDISKLFNGLPEGLSVGNPVFSKNSPYIIAFDLIDGINNRYDVFGANIETGDNGAIIVDNGDLGYPNFEKTDQSIIFEAPFSVFGIDIYEQGLDASKIAAAGQTNTLVENRIWGVLFSNGNRSLMVDAEDITTANTWLSVSPNPVQDMTYLDFVLEKSADIQATVFDVASKQVRNQNINGQAGDNRITMDMSDLNAGTYFIHLSNGERRAVLQVVKL